MKANRFILVFSIIVNLVTLPAFGQQPLKSYADSWKKTEEFVKKNLPQSALAEVKKIYAQAKKDKQDAQIIKALTYMTMLQESTMEGNDAASIKEIENEIAISKEPVVAILNSLLAEKYWNYYQANRWKFYNRTQTANFKKEDIATWTANDFHKKVGELYLKSISPEKLLQQTKLEPFDAIITKGNVRHLRPTLFDLLAHRALGYFQNDERDINRPAYSFEISQAAAFDPASDFIHRKFVTSDSLSLQHKALLTYQKLIAFHLNDARPDALIDVDLLRYEFVRSKSVHPDKDQLYFYGINHIAHQYGDTPAAAQAWYLAAAYYNEQASQYQPYGDTAHRFEKLKAKEICEKILSQKDSSEGKVNCANLLNQLNSKGLQFHVEKVNLPAQPFRALVEYRNFNTLYLRVIKVDEKIRTALDNIYEDAYWKTIINANPLRSWTQLLPATNDLQQHRAEIKIDALPAGEYLLAAATDKEYANESTIVGVGLFYVSRISFVNNGKDYFILDRDNGQPLAGAMVSVKEQKYDYKTSKYRDEAAGSYTSDNNGFFQIKTPNTQEYAVRNYKFDISYGGEKLNFSNYINDFYFYTDTKIKSKPSTGLYLFTDRSIYRPGQTIYFKAIAYTKDRDGKEANVLADYETTLYLKNASAEIIDSLILKTNEFGSVSGKFKLPGSGLNGIFGISAKSNNGAISFRVEEYKRPKFYVDYQPLKDSYRVNDTIRITGLAKAYAGNNIDGALVKYRIVRQPRFPYPWLFWRGWFPPVKPLEIAHGEAKTDKDGRFQIAFKAIPDLQIDKKLEPSFDYTVYADVTDINGETRSGQQTVSVSYKALLLKTNIPERLPADSLKSLSIRTENNNGEFVPALVNLNISRLKKENRLVRERYWERPDQFVMTKEEYIRNFPHDEYDNETDYKSWEREEKVYEQTDSAKVTSEFKIKNSGLNPGFYAIEISTKDRNGEEIKTVEYIELYDEKDKQLNLPEYLWTEAVKAAEPGEKASVKLGTAADNLFVIQQTSKQTVDSTKDVYSFTKLNNEKTVFDFPISEADRGGLAASWIFVKHNRVYQYTQPIIVPWSNKDLTIEYATYRDKTLPGSEEKWKLKISGDKNQKKVAEVLASMYDASLDQFYPFKWNKPFPWFLFFKNFGWNGKHNFLQQESNQRPMYSDFKIVEKNYDFLLSYATENAIIVGYGVRREIRADDRMVSAAPPLAQQRKSLNYEAKEKSGYFDFTMSDSTLVTQGLENTTPEPADELQIRKNFNETAFFFPELRTDSTGAIEFSFTLPDALTRWKFQALAHTKDLAFGYSSKEIITQKQLMVQPNPTRFMREGDKMEFSAKIVNLTDKELTGTAEFQLFDAATNEPVDGLFRSMVPNQYFTVAAGQSEAVKFPIEVPYQFNKALVWRIVAKAESFSDGEENTLPVLTNKSLVTESLPMALKGNETRNFSFDKLLNSGNSETLQHYALTVEYTSNPAWYAVQALPYLMEYPYDCAEQTWNRYYANSLASFIAGSSSRIREVFEKWKIKDTTALLSNLQKNEELKSVLLEETPWVLQAKTEAQQKKNIALLFDAIRMQGELNSSFEKLKQAQSPNGGFTWFKGGPDDRYITQYIVTGIGHLFKINASPLKQQTKLAQIIATALPYLDKKIKEEYDNLVKSKTDLKKYTPGYSVIQYLYMRSFFPQNKIAAATQTAYNYFKARAAQTWTQQNKYMQGTIALALYRTGDTKTPAAILLSLKETSINNNELGRYWKDAQRSWRWYEAPIERQALLIEAFQEVGKDNKTVDELRTWLLKNKQTNNWESTRATAEACYALLLKGSDWLTNDPSVQIKLGSTTLSSAGTEQEAGTGYFKKTIESNKVRASMGNISVSVSSGNASSTAVPSWGAVYWQYFEDLDKISYSATPLKLQKKLFVETNSDRGPVLKPVNDGDALKVGDKIKVRIELRVDRDMEYVHMKDMRAAAMEPVNVLSTYKWQDGLGYYESTRDASTNFFFNDLRKGTYVFEYTLFVTHTGNFSNGITTIQCMYAPEFTAHSEGIRVNVE